MTAPVLQRYVYQGRLDRVIDGDTYDIWIDCGFRMQRLEALRLRGVNTPERKAGAAATARVQQLLTQHEPLLIQTFKDTPQSFARYVADIWLSDGRSVAQILLDEGLAVPMKG